MAHKETPTEEVIKLYQMGMNDSETIRRLTEEGFSPVQISDALNQAKIKQQISSKPSEELTPLPPLLPPSKAPPWRSAPAPSQPMFPQMPPMQPRPQQPAQQMMPAPAPMMPAPPVPAQEIMVPRPTAVPPAPARAASPGAKPQAEESYPYAYPTYDEQAGGQPKIGAEAIEEIAEEIVEEKWREIKSKISDVVEWKAYAEKRVNSIEERVKRIELSIDRLQAALLSKVNEYGRSVKDLGAEMTSLESALGKILSPLVDNVKELGKITEDLKAEKESVRRKISKKI